MHLLFLADGLFPFVVGGMQKHSTMLIKHLSPLVDQITVCTCGELNAAPPTEQEILGVIGTSKNNVQVFTSTFKDTGNLPGHYLRANRRLSRKFLELVGDLSQYDSVYAQGLTGDAFLGKHSRLMINLHGLEMFQPAHSIGESLVKRLMQPTFKRQICQSWKVVSLGGKLGDMLKANGACDEQVVELSNGVDDVWFDKPTRGSKGESIRFLMVGRNEYRKGFHILDKALSLLKKTIELHLVGDWPQLESTLHNLTYHGVVREKEQMMEIMDSCDVLLLPSLSEGMPTVVLEAKARGLQVIATDVGAMKELETELMLPGDAKELAHKMSSVNRTSDMSGLSEKFRWSEIAKDTLKQLA